MSSFFEPPPPPPDPRPQPPLPPWAGAREGVIGKTVALNLEIGRSDKAALWIPAVMAYLDGFEFDIELRYRLDEEEFEDPFFWSHRPRGRRPSEEEVDPGILRFGIQFSDGRKATNLDNWMPFPMPGDPDELPEGPVLLAGDGGGGAGRGREGSWVWPLPPEGPLVFLCEWPAADIPETRNEDRFGPRTRRRSRRGPALVRHRDQKRLRRLDELDASRVSCLGRPSSRPNRPTQTTQRAKGAQGSFPNTGPGQGLAHSREACDPRRVAPSGRRSDAGHG